MLVKPVNCPPLSLSLWHCALWLGNPLHTQLQFSIPIIAAGPWWFRAGQAPLLLDNANDYIRANWMGPGGDEHLGSNMQYWGSSTVICCGVRVLFLFEVWTRMVEQLTCRSVWLRREYKLVELKAPKSYFLQQPLIISHEVLHEEMFCPSRSSFGYFTEEILVCVCVFALFSTG